MSEQRLIDANKLNHIHIENYGEAVDWNSIEYADEVDPETLPIVQQLRAELERVTAERDAAVEDLRRECEKCLHYRVTWNGCTPDFECQLSGQCLNGDMWEWRGLQEDENE